MTIVEKAAYLKGLTEGLGVEPDSRDGKLWAALNELLSDMAHEIEDLQSGALDFADALDEIGDELGYLGIDKEGADLLFQLVSRRYERRSTIVTTNVGIGAWAKVFGNPVTASAIADRICHHCTVLKITGRSYRTKDLRESGEAGDGDAERG